MLAGVLYIMFYMNLNASLFQLTRTLYVYQYFEEKKKSNA